MNKSDIKKVVLAYSGGLDCTMTLNGEKISYSKKY